LNGEVQRLRNEIDRLKLAHDAAVDKTHALKLQLDEQFLVNTSNPSVTAVSMMIYYELINCMFNS
jgi:hypothetical protein